MSYSISTRVVGDADEALNRENEGAMRNWLRVSDPRTSGCVSLNSVVDFRGADKGPSGSSQPPDARSYSRPLIPEDLAVARRTPPARDPQVPGPNFELVALVDVNNVDFTNGSEPSIAVNPENPNVIAVHAGFRDWGPAGHNCASLFVSTNGGTTWNRVASVDPPTNISV